MDWSLLLLLTFLTVGFLINGLGARGRFYEFPFLAAAMFLTFVLPQIPGLANSRFMPEGALAKTLFFSFLCLAALGMGWKAGLRRRCFRDFDFCEKRLLIAATFLSVTGAYFFYKFGQLPDDARLRGNLTGLPVAYLFFAKLLTYGLAVALICYAARPTKWALGVILFDTMFYLERIVIAGRRGETAELFLLIGLAFWFERRWAVPRPLVVGGILMAIVGLLGAGEYREATYYNGEPNWSAVKDIDLARNWDRLVSEGGEEMRNAAQVIHQMDKTRTFNYGLSHWNSIVATFVPAQLVGHAIKNSLMVDMPDDFARGYEASRGTTHTGMADSFSSFWYFGAIKFFAMAFVFAIIFNSGMRGNTIMQVIYMLSAVPSMLFVTHFTNEIVIAWIHMFIFLLPVFYYARTRSAPASRPDARGLPAWGR